MKRAPSHSNNNNDRPTKRRRYIEWLLPVELWHEIAKVDLATYRVLVHSIPRFTRSLTPSIRTDYQIHFGFSVKITSYCIAWLRNKKLHRVGGPAVEFLNTSKAWWVDGKAHRLNGPAIEDSDGYKEWWVDDKRHRMNEPAVVWPNGDKEWWVDGKKLAHMHPPCGYKSPSDDSRE